MTSVELLATGYWRRLILSNCAALVLSLSLSYSPMHIQRSRAWQIAWLCEEVGLDYDIRSAKKSPIILDGELLARESGAVRESAFPSSYG